MFNSTPKPMRSLFRRPRHHSVTVIDTPIHNAAASKAKLAFWLTLVFGGLLAALFLPDEMHIVFRVILGGLITVPLACVVWVAVRIWPVLRIFWWWSPQLTLTLLLAWALKSASELIGGTLALIGFAVLAGGLAAIPQVRRWVWALVMCQVMRHRLRVAFSDFIKSNQHGTLPLILWARPVPAGVQVWVWLRSGLAKADIDTRLERLAVTCLSDEVRTERASASYAALIRFDIKRRDVLKRTVPSPLLSYVDAEVPPARPQLGAEPEDLDLKSITDDMLNASQYTTFKPDSTRKPRKGNGTSGNEPAPPSANRPGWGDPDLHGWGDN